MRRRLASVAATLGLALGAPALGLASAPAACAATDQRAALVVDTGTDARSYCVALEGDTVSGTDLIRLAHEQYGLDYRLGFGGRAVCRLAGVGVDGEDCFDAYPDFWGYWHGDGSGGWTWAGGSAADWTVEAGDVEGWQFGPGQDGGTHEAPPSTRAEDVCEPAGPSPPPSPGGGDDDAGGGSGPMGGSEDGGADVGGGVGVGDVGPSPSATGERVGSDEERQPRDRVHVDATPADSATPSPTGAPPVTLAAGEGPGDTGSGGSTGALLAAAAVVALGGAGAFVLRRRRTG
jgi:hypothetical protein